MSARHAPREWFGLVLLIAVGMLAGCGGVVPSAGSAASATQSLPGPRPQLPPDAEIAEGSEWQPSAGRLPPGIDPTARYPDTIAAMMALTEPFGRRAMPPGAPGITSQSIEAPEGEDWLIVSVPTFGDPAQWGEQWLLIVRQDDRGWGLGEAFSRRLCVDAAEGTRCTQGP